MAVKKVTKPSVKPAITAAKKASTAAPKGKAKPPKSVSPMIKPAAGSGLTVEQWQRAHGVTPPAQPVVNLSGVRAWAQAARAQLAKLNPNNWGPGMFQGMPDPSKAPSISEILRNAGK